MHEENSCYAFAESTSFTKFLNPNLYTYKLIQVRELLLLLRDIIIDLEFFSVLCILKTNESKE